MIDVDFADLIDYFGPTSARPVSDLYGSLKDARNS